MKLLQAVELANLASRARNRLAKKEILDRVDPSLRKSVTSKVFFYARVATNRLAAPISIAAAKGPIVVDVNSNNIGKLRNGFKPGVIVVAGHTTFEQATAQRLPRVDVWVGQLAANALGIKADDAIGSDELKGLLQNKLNEKIGVRTDSVTDKPWIQEVYPFEGYCIYNYKNVMYKHNFTMNVVLKTVALTGNAIEVDIKYPEKTVMGSTPGTLSDMAFLHACNGNETCPCSVHAQKKKLKKISFACVDAKGKGVTVRTIKGRFLRACNEGFKPRMHSKAPAGPGWEGLVRKLKKEKSIDNPFALAHWMKKEGYRPS